MRLTVALAVVALGVGIWIGYGSREKRAPTRTPESAHEARPTPVETPPTASGGTYEGTVALSDGTPVAGVRIFAMAEDADTEPRTTTDANGHYRIDGLPADRYMLHAQRDGYRITLSPEWTSATIPVDERVDFVATKLRVCTVEVRLPGGGRAEHANLHWTPRPPRTQYNWTPKLNSFELSPGAYEVSATSGSHRELQSKPVAVPDTPELDVIVLQLESRTGIRGTVIVPPGAKPRGLEVRIGPAHQYRADRAFRFGRSPRLRGTKNAFVQLDLKPGTYKVVALLGHNRIVAETEVTIANGIAECELKLESSAPERSRVVRVLGPDGKPVPNVGFSCRYSGPRGGAAGPCTVAERDDGSFLVSPLRIDHETEGGQWTLSVGSRELGAIRRVFDPDDPTEFLIEFPAPAHVRVAVDGAAKLPGMLFVHVQPAGEPDAQRGFSASNIDASGIAKLGPVPSGDVEILLGVQQGTLFWPVTRKTVRLQAGDNTASITAPVLYDVKVVSAAPPKPETSPTHRVLLRPVGKDGEVYLAYHRIPKGDSATLTRLAAGRYTITGYLREEKKSWKRTFTVPGTSEVNIP